MTKIDTDYSWFDESFSDLAEAYCITLVRGLSPDELLSRLGARPAEPQRGMDAVLDAAHPEDQQSEDVQFVATTAVGDWTLLIEPNGYLGTTESIARPASAGTTWVSHYLGVNGDDAFLWAEDQNLRLFFHPESPDDRDGSTPDALLDVMTQVGFNLEQDYDDPFAEDNEGTPEFALAEHLTGVVLTPELLESTTFVCATIPMP